MLLKWSATLISTRSSRVKFDFNGENRMKFRNARSLNSTVAFLGGAALLSSALVACGDDSSSSGNFSMEDSFEMVLAKADYQYSKKDSTLKIIKPVCKEGTIGNLVGPEDADKWDTLSYKAYESKGFVYLQEKDKDKVKYSLDDGEFLDGFWTDPNYDSQKIQEGFHYDDDGMVQSVLRYTGECLMKDFYSLFRKDAPAIRDMDKTLTEFYGMFLAEGEVVKEKKMLEDIRAVDCDELSMFDGLVKLNAEDFNESSGNIKISYGNRTCNVSFQIRYAYDQDDCSAAYEEFSNHKNAKKEFNFEDYSFDVTYSGDDDDYCLDYLILDLKKEKGVPTRRNISSRDFANGVVKLMLVGMK